MILELQFQISHELSPLFKNFGSIRNSLNPTERPHSDDSLCHVIESCKIFGST